MNELSIIAAVAVAVGVGYYAYQNTGSETGVIVSDLETKVDIFMQAVASAEGYGADPNNVPTRANNPGDLGPGDCGAQYPVINAVGSRVSILPSPEIGWQILHDKIYRAFSGRSAVFSPSMTIQQFAQKYAGSDAGSTVQNPGPWARNVASFIGVSPNTVIADWLAS